MQYIGISSSSNNKFVLLLNIVYLCLLILLVSCQSTMVDAEDATPNILDFGLDSNQPITNKAGIVGNYKDIDVDNKDLLTLVNSMKKSISKQRFLYVNKFSAESTTVKSKTLDLSILSAKQQDCYLCTDGQKLMQGRRNVNVGGYSYVKMEDFLIGSNFQILLKVLDNNDNQCTYFRMRLYRDHLKLVSIQELICYDALPPQYSNDDQIKQLNPIVDAIRTTPNNVPVGNAADSHSTFKVMSYNLWNYNSPWKQRRNMIVDNIVKQDPELIAFQEVRYSAWDGETNYMPNPRMMGQERNQIQHLVSLLSFHNKKYHYTSIPSMVYPNGQQFQYEGLAILSKYPIKDTSSIKLTRNFVDSEDVHQRSCLGVTVDSPNGPINLFTSHFSLSLSGATRNAFEVFNFTKQFEGPQIFVGDLNSTPDSEAIRFLVGEATVKHQTGDFQDSFTKWSSEGRSVLFQGNSFSTLGGVPSKRIDFIMKRGSDIELVDFQQVGSKPQKSEAPFGEDVYASDHLALISTYKWVSKSQPSPNANNQNTNPTAANPPIGGTH